ncbi:MAG: NADH-quinone oxidoreductase subunit NuoF [Armatimonadetes bacterium]|nr:NADH-quinone oxidoreductase subunit NuoF [Armatimonadota bacterium]
MPEVKILTRFTSAEAYPEQYRIERALENGYYEMARQAVTEMAPDDIIEMVKGSGLRGRGGAGAPCGMKWGFMPKAPTETRPNYLICNADESEPGTYSNREILENDPHQLIDGMIIAAFALRVRRMFIYCRGEFVLGADRVAGAIEEAYRKGFLGKNIFGTSFSTDLILHRGAGAYICGEETALMDSLEGKRGHPRSKPPFPANAGLYGMPTTINNVETLCNVPHLIRHGVEWFRAMGTEKSTGTKVLSVSGHVKRPRNYEIVMGTPIQELVYDLAGGIREDRELKAVIPGGSSMPMLPKDLALKTNLDFESLQQAGSALGSGGFMAFDETTDIVQVCEVIARFYKNESCGKCVPCRIGTDWVHKTIYRIVRGQGRMEDIELLRGICVNLAGERMMDSRSFCPLGDAAAWPIIWGGLKHFQHEFEYWIRHKKSPVGREVGVPAL